MDVPLIDLELSVRSHQVALALGVTTAAELHAAGLERILTAAGVDPDGGDPETNRAGLLVFREIRDSLLQHGFPDLLAD